MDESLAVPLAILIPPLPATVLLPLIGVPVLVLIPSFPFSIELVYVSIKGHGFLCSLHQPCVAIRSGSTEALLGDASWESFEEFHEDRGFPQIVVGFSRQHAKALVVFFYVVILHFEVFDLQPRFGVSVSVQESIIESVEEVEPRVWVFIARVESVSLNSDEVPDEGSGYKSEGEGYFALISVQGLHPSI